MWIGEAISLSFAVGGLAVVAQTFAVIFTVMKVFGVAYLLFLAWRMWFAPTQAGKLVALLAPLASKSVTAIVGFTETVGGGKLYNAAAVFRTISAPYIRRDRMFRRLRGSRRAPAAIARSSG